MVAATPLAVDVTKFNATIEAWAAGVVPEQLVTLQKHIGLLCLQKFTESTPVDKGRARGGWQVFIGDGSGVAPSREDPGSGSAPQSASGPTFSDGSAVIGSLHEGLPFAPLVIENAVPYIERLMLEGYSQQAAVGIFNTLLEDVEAEIESEIGEPGDLVGAEFGGGP